MTFEITSTANPKIKRLVKLRERRHRDSEDVFVVEGSRLFERAVEADLTPLEVYVDGTVTVEADLGPTTVAPEVLDRASYRKQSEGVIAVFAQFRTGFEDLTLGDPALVLAVEGLEKPGNLGAALRTADAVGADVVFALGETIDLFNPNVLRSSTGAVFTVPVVESDLTTAHRWLSKHAVELVTADPAAPTPYWEANLSGPVAILVGAEDRGLSETARGLSGTSVRLPMAGTGDSLNTSVALGILAYDALRQRSVIEY